MQHNASVRYRLLAQGRRARVDALLGDEFAAQAAYVDEHGPGLDTGIGRHAECECAGALKMRRRLTRPIATNAHGPKKAARPASTPPNPAASAVTTSP